MGGKKKPQACAVALYGISDYNGSLVFKHLFFLGKRACS